MEIMDLLTSMAGMATALGGFELVKWVMNRKSNSRIANAHADLEETKADGEEFALLRSQIEFLQSQLVEKEKRFAEQTEIVRKLNLREIELTQEIGKIKLEYALKRCDVAHCPKREPPTGF